MLLHITLHRTAIIVLLLHMVLFERKTYPNLVYAETFQCTTPTSIEEKRLPAVLEVENVCQNSHVSLCLEYSGSNYLIRSIPPGGIEAIPTVLNDCWIYRAETCEGPILQQHSILGNRKVTVGCSALDSSAFYASLPHMTSIDCSLTVVPAIATAYEAALQYLPSNLSSLIDSQRQQTDIDNPIISVLRDDFLNNMYTHGVWLARHGVQLNQSMEFFLHARALLHYTQRCHSYMVGKMFSLPRSYFAVYGSTTASIIAKAKRNGSWIEGELPLSSAQQETLNVVSAGAVSIDESEPFPYSLFPPAGIITHTPNASDYVVLRSVTRQATSPKGKGNGNGSTNGSREVRVGLARQTVSEGQSYCDRLSANWKYFRVTKSSEHFTAADCCSTGCFSLEESSTTIALAFTSTFTENCCYVCNLANLCSDNVKPTLKALQIMSEIHAPPESDMDLAPPIRITI